MAATSLDTCAVTAHRAVVVGITAVGTGAAAGTVVVGMAVIKTAATCATGATSLDTCVVTAHRAVVAGTAVVQTRAATTATSKGTSLPIAHNRGRTAGGLRAAATETKAKAAATAAVVISSASTVESTATFRVLAPSLATTVAVPRAPPARATPAVRAGTTVATVRTNDRGLLALF